MNIILFIVAIILNLILATASIIYTPVKYIISFKWSAGLKHLNKFFLKLAVSLDQFGNTACKEVLNDTLLIKQKGSNVIQTFGNEDDTVSYILGINYYSNNLTQLGKSIVYILDLIDKYHVEKAILSKFVSDQKSRYRLKQPSNYYISEIKKVIPEKLLIFYIEESIKNFEEYNI